VTEPVPTTQDHPSGSFLPPEWEQLAAEFARQRDEARAEVSRLTSALSTAEQERDQLQQQVWALEQAHVMSVEVGRQAAEAELERTREVVEAAKAWREVGPSPDCVRALVAAVDALRTDKEGADGP
jgi:hypothetical protein